MSPEQFCYWLQGFMEISGIGTEDDLEGIHPDQTKVIRDHLTLVFQKETPIRQTNVKDILSGLQWGGGGAVTNTSLDEKEDMSDSEPICSPTIRPMKTRSFDNVRIC